MVIWKYALPLEVVHAENARPVVSMPSGAKVLAIQMQGDVPTLWALVDTVEPVRPRRFVFHGTGHALTGTGRYVGTVQLYAGSLVLHCFEEA